MISIIQRILQRDTGNKRCNSRISQKSNGAIFGGFGIKNRVRAQCQNSRLSSERHQKEVTSHRASSPRVYPGGLEPRRKSRARLSGPLFISQNLRRFVVGEI